MTGWGKVAVGLAVAVLGLGVAFNVSRSRWFTERDALVEQVASERAVSGLLKAQADSLHKAAANAKNRADSITTVVRRLRAALPAVTPDTCKPYLALADSTQAEADGWHSAYDQEREASGKLREAYTLAAGSRDSAIALLKRAPGTGLHLFGLPIPDPQAMAESDPSGETRAGVGASLALGDTRVEVNRLWAIGRGQPVTRLRVTVPLRGLL